MKFIYLCAAILILSFTVIPVFSGISKEHAVILANNNTIEQNQQDTALSFEEIYEIAAQGQDEFDPASLNAITPAAGEDIESFPSSFSGISDAALTDAIVPLKTTINTIAE